MSRLTLEKVLRYALIALVIAAVAYLLWFFSSLVIYLMVGVVLAYLLNPLATAFEAQGLGRVPAILLTFAAMVAVLVLVAMLLVPFLTEQAVSLGALVDPERLNRIAISVENALARHLPVPPGSVRESVLTAIQALFQQDRLTAWLGATVGVFTTIVYALVIVPFAAFFFLKDGRYIQERILGLVPNRYFEITLGIVAKVETTIGRYFRALFKQTVSVGALATVMLMLVGLKGALVVGVFTGLANTIPYFGPALGFAAGSLVGIAQTGDFSMIPGVLLAMAVTQASDNLFFQPYYFSRAARTHPLLILCAVLIGAELAGILGMLIAIPVMTILRVTIQEVVWSVRNYRIFRTPEPAASAEAG
jgi:predicted PurR-regulated permease PerM